MLRYRLINSNKTTVWITILIMKYVIGMFESSMIVVAILNVAYSKIVYGYVKEDLLYTPYHTM